MPLPNLSNLPALKKNLPLIIAAISALAAVFLINYYVQQQGEAEKRRIAEEMKNYRKVLVAKSDIPQGAQITEEMLDEASIHKDKIEPNAATSVTSVLGRIAAIPFSKGEQLRLDKLVAPQKVERPQLLSAMIPPGKRAVTIKADDLSSVGGMVNAGDHVDVVGMISMPETEGPAPQSARMTILPLFQDVLVLAVNQELLPAPAGKKGAVSMVTLALSPQEGSVIAFIEEQGKVRLVLRSPKDKQAQRIIPADWDSVLKFLLPQEAERPKRKIEIYHGLKREIKNIQ